MIDNSRRAQHRPDSAERALFTQLLIKGIVIILAVAIDGPEAASGTVYLLAEKEIARTRQLSLTLCLSAALAAGLRMLKF